MTIVMCAFVKQPDWSHLGILTRIFVKTWCESHLPVLILLGDQIKHLVFGDRSVVEPGWLGQKAGFHRFFCCGMTVALNQLYQHSSQMNTRCQMIQIALKYFLSLHRTRKLILWHNVIAWVSMISKYYWSGGSKQKPHNGFVDKQ